MTARYRFLATLALSCGVLCLASTPSTAQIGGISVRAEDMEQTIAPMASVDFHIFVRNNFMLPVDLHVVRVTNEMPDASWNSVICTKLNCYFPETDHPDPVPLQPGEETEVKLTVTSGNTSTGVAKVVLQFQAGGEEPITQEITANLATAGVNDPIVVEIPSAAYPNPAVSYALIPVTGEVASEDLSLRIVDLQGHTVRELSNPHIVTVDGRPGIRVDVSAIANGTYLYQLTNKERRTAGSIVVSH